MSDRSFLLCRNNIQLHFHFSYIKEGAPHVQLHLTLLSALIATNKERLAMQHSHLWAQEMCRHMSLYRNREALTVDLCLLYKGMTIMLSRTILACQAKGLMNILLSTLHFWQPRVQVILISFVYFHIRIILYRKKCFPGNGVPVLTKDGDEMPARYEA